MSFVCVPVFVYVGVSGFEFVCVIIPVYMFVCVFVGVYVLFCVVVLVSGYVLFPFTFSFYVIVCLFVLALRNH